ncbi:enoyl-CoA hydratase-related protein (plasmid) [Streptomyces sp. HUAS 31]|uniref:enoyl-CoA hydratase/isomerase family protein n=1 Tax=Streptomyces TaxID=1883 RepID=UPI002306A1B8|nr:enoyl-CoA hydratase-related protein [Streptomyces sp. HUAS 31]WCE02493.1 enoyl-CoA hydratase-related protein [Streptomyces sp. HUAS 31]
MSGTTEAEESVLVAREGPVLRVTLNRPHRKNAMTEDSWDLLGETLRTARADERVRAVVLAGAGGDFCAGADLTETRSRRHPMDRMRRLGDVALALHEMPKPVIAEVEGVAVGAGWNLALGCDLVVASTTARFSQIFARRGLSVDFGGTWLLPRLIGLQQAKRLALLADFVDAEEALRLGLVTWVRPPEGIGAFVDDLATRLAAGPPVAMAQSKQMLNEASGQSLREALESESRAQVVNLATDAPAARQAFQEGTEPRFEGRWQLYPPQRPPQDTTPS